MPDPLSGPWGTSVTAPANPVYQADWAALFGRALPYGVIGNPASTDLKLSAAGNAYYTMAPGRAVNDGTGYSQLAAINITPANNSTGSTRADLVVLRKDFTGQTLQYVVIAGTGPTIPTITAGDIRIGVCQVPAGYGVSVFTVPAGAITDLRDFAFGPGGVIPCRTVLDLNVASQQYPMVALEFATGLLKISVGAGWQTVNLVESWATLNSGAFAPGWGNAAGVIATGTADPPCRVRLMNPQTARLQGYLQRNTGQTTATGPVTVLQLPNPTHYAPARTHRFVAMADTTPLHMAIQSTGVVSLQGGSIAAGQKFFIDTDWTVDA